MSATPPDNPGFDITQFLGYTEQIFKNLLRRIGAGLFLIGKVASTFVLGSGNPFFAIPGKTGTSPDANKTNKVIIPYSAWGANAPVADELAGLLEDFDENRVAVGKIVDLIDALIDAQRYGSWPWVKPGNDVTHLSANTEQSTTSSTYETKKAFQVPYFGRYRVSVELSRSGGTTSAQIWIVKADGTEVAASNEVTYNGTVHPTFGAAQNLDMNLTVHPGDEIRVKIKNDLGPAQTGYVQNCNLLYSEATAIQAPSSAVLMD